MNINNLKVGDIGIIDYVEGNDKLSKRLLSLGCTKGTSIKLKRKAPFGDPIILTVRGFDIALRKKDAKYIYLQAS